MMLKPSIDSLLDRVNSKYSLVILASKRAHELDAGAQSAKRPRTKRIRSAYPRRTKAIDKSKLEHACVLAFSFE